MNKIYWAFKKIVFSYLCNVNINCNDEDFVIEKTGVETQNTNVILLTKDEPSF